MAQDLNLGDLKITLETFEGDPVRAKFDLPDGSTVARNFPENGELTMRLGLGLGLNRVVLNAPASLLISGTPVLTATEGQAYDGFIVSASGGVPPYTYSLVGTWPAGISINASTGEVSGTPTETGTFAGLSVRVTDANSDTADLAAFSLTVSSNSFPVVEARATGDSALSTTSHAITLPAGVQPGEMLVVAFSCDDNHTISIGAGTGWTMLSSINNSVGTPCAAIFWKIADGSDSLTVATDTADLSTHVSFRISGAAALTGTGLDGGTSINSNPPPHTPPNGSKKYLWIVTRHGDSTAVATAAPAGYSNLTTVAVTSTFASTSTAERQLEAASEDPGPFTSVNEQWICFTLAVEPQ